MNVGYFTHRSVLKTVLNLINNKPILELGCGEGSTSIIHEWAIKNKVKVTTIDSQQDWLSKYEHFKHSLHEFICIDNFNNWIPYLIEKNINWGLVFIDQGCWESRKDCLFYLKDKVDYVILHDCCYYPKNNIFGKITQEETINCCSSSIPNHCACVPAIKNFKKHYNDIFLYSKEYNSPYGPPTLLGSNFFDISELEINMSELG